MSEPAPKAYTVRQGDSLGTIAQKFSIANWKFIYNASCNEALRSKRKNPDQIQPGDVLFIPVRRSDLRAHNEERLRRLQATRTYLCRIYDQQLKELDAAFNTVQRTSDGVDAVWTLVQLGLNVREAAKLGEMTIGKHGKVLKALNEKLQKTANDICKDLINAGIRDPALEAIVKDRDAVKDGVIWAVGRIGVEALLKYNAPSFWFWTYFQLKRGKSWREAVSESPEDVYNDSKADFKRAKESALRNIDKRIWEVKRMIMS